MSNKKHQKYEAVIGLEIHAELKTNSKMFCGCKNETFSVGDKRYAISTKPNTNVCPVCLGMPGILPDINKQAVEWTILTGLALNCKINKFTKWDRKNYFYPDLPKGYQISQYDLPIAHNGSLKLKTKNEKLKTIGITRIHLEEDTGTLKHPEGRAEVDYSLADYNRAGVPLMELVTEPDLRSAKEAKEFCQKYQLILRTLGVSDANMEKGELRCEANISIRKISNFQFPISNQISNSKKIKLGTKVEIKNLNSFKSVEKSIEYEIERQAEALESGEKIIQQTCGWDEKNGKTYVMRTKETSADYRYFPEPDLPPIVIGGNSKLDTRNSKQIQPRTTSGTGLSSTLRGAGQNSKPKIQNMINIDEIRRQLPELPEQKLQRYVKEYGLRPEDAEVIVSNLEMMKYFELCIKYKVLSIKQLANWIVNEIPDLSVKPEYLIELVNLIEEGKISRKIAKDILPEIKAGKSALEIIKEKGLEQISDSDEIEKTIDQIIKNNPEVVAKIKSGKMGVMGFLVGQIMKETKGQANPKMVNELLRKKIS